MTWNLLIHPHFNQASDIAKHWPRRTRSSTQLYGHTRSGMWGKQKNDPLQEDISTIWLNMAACRSTATLQTGRSLVLTPSFIPPIRSIRAFLGRAGCTARRSRGQDRRRHRLGPIGRKPLAGNSEGWLGRAAAFPGFQLLSARQWIYSGNISCKGCVRCGFGQTGCLCHNHS